jgi:dolichyl-phosphate-mannose-protein mannosyltransferase
MTKTSKILLCLIIFTGLGLRLYRIGAKPFWVDELGVAIAAMTPTLADALNVAHGHVMAMPLDYVVAWLMAHVSVSEGWLRFPEALWGTLSLAAGFLLYRQLLEERAAFIATFLLALSPVLIEYSQELRFYTPLVFFYTLGAAAGLQASRKGRAIDWLAFTMTCLAGIFFHIYAALALIPVSLWTLAEKQTRQRNLPFFSLSTFLILIGAEYAMYTYGSFPGETSALFAFESPPQVILGGLGWMPVFPASASAWLFSVFSLLFALLGIRRLLASAHQKYVLILVISMVLQIGILLGVAAIKNYFASARQLIFLVPLSVLFSAAGIDSLLQKIQNESAKQNIPAPLLYTLIVFFLGCLVFPALQQYYVLEKGATRSILDLLSKEWQPGQIIYITPGYNRDLYAFYASRSGSNSELAHSFLPLEVVANQDLSSQAAFVISEPSFDATPLGFDRIFVPSMNTLYPEVLWQRHK